MSVFYDNLPVFMFLLLFALFLIGYPIAFSLAVTGVAFGVIAVGAELMSATVFWGIPENIWGRVMMNDTLLAIPFFTLMGLILERSGMAEDLLETVTALFGKIRGGAAFSVVFVGAALAATTGIVAASVMTMGLIALPVMLRHGYDRSLAAGVIAGAGTLAQIIPPSLVLIVLADQLQVSVGDMYAGALYPSMMLVGMYLIYVSICAIFFPKSAPAAPVDLEGGVSVASALKSMLIPLILTFYAAFTLFFPYEASVPLRYVLSVFEPGALSYLKSAEFIESAKFIPAADYAHFVSDELKIKGYALSAFVSDPLLSTLMIVSAIVGVFFIYMSILKKQDPNVVKVTAKMTASLLPPVILVFLVLGLIFRGVATPTEGGAAGAAGALALAYLKRRISLPDLKIALEKTLKLSGFVMFILVGARIFSVIFYNLGGHHMVENLFAGLPGGEVGFLVTVNIMIFLLAFFLDFFELAFIVVPLLLPLAHRIGIDPVWFGVMIGMNMQTSFLHPPFGFSLFFLRSVAPKEPYQDTVTGRMIDPVTSKQIYRGAIPFLVMQLIAVGMIIAFPGMVISTHDENFDLNTIMKSLPERPAIEEPKLLDLLL